MTTAGQRIAVLGAGSWGTALALLLARNGYEVNLWGHHAEHMAFLTANHENKTYLPDFPFPYNIHPTADINEALHDVQFILLVVPSSAFVETLERIKPAVSADAKLVWGTKGIDPASNRLLSDCAAEILPDMPLAILSGSSFAKEVALDLPTAVTIASDDEQWLQECVDLFAAPHFRVYPSSDMIGSQICGVVKNVLAIAAGIGDGMELGYNARSALITRGLAEMARLVEAMGGSKQTVMGLCGLGDLVLTCTGDLSRNRRFGFALGEGKSAQAAKQEIGQAIEGMDNAEQIHQLLSEYSVDMPICTAVYRIIHHELDPREALNQLLERKPSSYS
ncbi:MAG: NAD(P)-dependent glycerol-3-phosphate dehydrogenase [Coxiellaceae bacterium]|nr:NAD(P)-dependent glycerol-3-phosphate dehydrogenase [Coxiellaceae bacterium]